MSYVRGINFKENLFKLVTFGRIWFYSFKEHTPPKQRRPSDRDVNWMSPVQGKSPPVQVKEPYGNFDMVTCRLSSCNPECTMYTCR